jgi:menaquinone-dependent protoporphyrinogen oxidase
MLKLLVVYGTTEGHTRRIARCIAETARGALHHVRELDATAVPRGFRVSDYDAVIVGASVHEGRHQSSVVHFVRESIGSLQRMPTAFFSVSLEAALAGEKHRDGARTYISDFLAETGWEPGATVPVAGALSFTKYEYLRRLAMDLIPHRGASPTDPMVDAEYTDWDAVQRFAREFLHWSERRRVLALPRLA